MNLHITPSFNIDRLCKTASVLLFLVLITQRKLFLKPMETHLNNMLLYLSMSITKYIKSLWTTANSELYSFVQAFKRSQVLIALLHRVITKDLVVPVHWVSAPWHHRVQVRPVAPRLDSWKRSLENTGYQDPIFPSYQLFFSCCL